MRRPGPSSRGSTAASPSASVGGTRAARRPAARTASSEIATPPAMAAAAGSQSASTVKLGGTMPWRTSACPSFSPSTHPGPDAGRRADQADERGLPADHAANLAGRRGDRAQQRDLALALLDRQPHRAGDDEHRDEQREPGERRRDGDQRDPRLLELGMLGLATCVAGEHLRAAGDGAQARGVEARAGEHADRVDASGMAGQPLRLGVGQEDRRLLRDGVPRAGRRPPPSPCGRARWRRATAARRARRGSRRRPRRVAAGGRPALSTYGVSARAAPSVGDGFPVAERGPAPTRRRSPPGRRARPPAGR